MTPGPLVVAGQPAQVEVVGIQTFGRLAFGAGDFRPLELRRDRGDDACGDLVLQFEDVVEGTLETVGPKVRSCRGIDQLGRDAQPPGGLAHAALEHVSHTELAANLSHIDRSAFEREA